MRAATFARETAEFLSLSEAEAYAAVCRGVALLEAAGLPRPRTFCAPGWLMTDAARRSVGRAGLRRISEMFSVNDLERRRRDLVPSIGFMGGSSAQETGVRILNRIVAGALASRSTAVAIYLHPQNGKDNPALLRVLERVAAMIGSGRWVPTTYSEWYGSD